MVMLARALLWLACRSKRQTRFASCNYYCCFFVEAEAIMLLSHHGQAPAPANPFEVRKLSNHRQTQTTVISPDTTGNGNVCGIPLNVLLLCKFVVPFLPFCGSALKCLPF